MNVYSTTRSWWYHKNSFFISKCLSELLGGMGQNAPPPRNRITKTQYINIFDILETKCSIFYALLSNGLNFHLDTHIRPQWQKVSKHPLHLLSIFSKNVNILSIWIHKRKLWQAKSFRWNTNKFSNPTLFLILHTLHYQT